MLIYIILSAVIAVLLLICIALAISKRRQTKRISSLTDEINDFILSGHKTDFSMNDNEFARLQNSISDLENMIELEKSNTVNEAKKNSQFIADVSHQLKTPIAALRLYCEMEYSENPNEHTKKELQLIEKMDRLVQNLLRLEKIRSDSYVMKFLDADVRDITNSLIEEFTPLFPEKNYTVSGKSRLRCDKIWMSEAIGNIIKNASEHTAPNGNVEIMISDNQNSTMIEIQDNGGGMEEQDIPNLFTRFYRTENALPTSTGIGLAITKAIIEKHHGIISAENKNNGLRVTMCIPHLDGYEALD